MSDLLLSSVKLPCGVTLPNRVAKAATTEGLADSWNRATADHARLYQAWAEGGSGLIITGNVQVDRRYMERPGNVAIDGPQDEQQLSALREYAKAAKCKGNHVFVQLSHGGRQSDRSVNLEGVGPSAGSFPLLAGGDTLHFREMSKDEIHGVVQRFVHAALVCKNVGFTGIQLHAAHGYLISSFLNPRANHRTDEYGGSLENRARLLLDTVKAIRNAVGASFPIAVKINSSDFQQGGFTLDECREVVTMLDNSSVDLIELSGGNYENPSMIVGDLLDRLKTNKSTAIREAYFMEFAKVVCPNVKKAAIMVTGGIRSRETMEKAIKSGDCHIIGIGRPICGMPDCINKLFAREIDVLPRYESTLDLPWFMYPLYLTAQGPKLRFFMQQTWYYVQEIRVGQGLGAGSNVNLFSCAKEIMSHDAAQAKSLQGLTCVGAVLNNNKKQDSWSKAAIIGGIGLGIASVVIYRLKY